MIDRNESLRDQIATIVQAGYSQRKTSVETADEIVTRLERELAEAQRTNMALADMLCEAQGAVKSMERELVVAKKNTARLEHLIRRTSAEQFARIACYRALSNSLAAIDVAMDGGK